MASMDDVVVVGGGAAGLSAAVALGRFRRSVTMVDAGEPRNAPAARATTVANSDRPRRGASRGHGVHNFLTRDGMAPAELRAAGRAEVEHYGGAIVCDTAVAATRTEDGFEVELGSGRTLAARRIVVASGLVDELPDIPGLAQRWGRDVLHCPYCHGWEVRDQPVGVLATGAFAVHQATMFRQLTDDVVVFAHTAERSVAEYAEELDALGIRVVTGEVTGLEVEDDALVGVRVHGSGPTPRRVLVVAPWMVAYSAVLDALGVKPEPHPLGGEHYPTDDGGATAVPGVWIAGNATDPMAQVVVAAGQGLTAAARLNADLIAEDTARAIDRARLAGKAVG